MVKIILEKQKPKVAFDGNFELKLGPILYRDDFTPFRTGTFKMCVESPYNVWEYISNDDLYEMYGEKLKQEFIQYLKNETTMMVAKIKEDFENKLKEERTQTALNIDAEVERRIELFEKSQEGKSNA